MSIARKIVDERSRYFLRFGYMPDTLTVSEDEFIELKQYCRVSSMCHIPINDPMLPMQFMSMNVVVSGAQQSLACSGKLP